MRSTQLAFALDEIDSESNLRVVAAALLGDEAAPVSPALLATTRRQIRGGGDPLGDAFSRIFSPAQRRESGSTLTPPAVVAQMLDLAASQLPAPARVVDCGAGSGRFTLAALRHFPTARVIACELNPLLALLLKANARAAGLDARLEVVTADFRELALDSSAGRTLFIGNPPYVRHHDIEPKWKRWYQAGLAEHGVAGSQLAGLHLHFFLRARQLARSGDVGCFITSAEWLDVNYGTSLRQLLLNGLGGRTVHLFPAEQSLFTDALTTSAITTFQVGGDFTRMGFVAANSPGRTATRWVPNAELLAARGWSAFAQAPQKVDREATARLGDYFKISRGQVTGLNRVWIAGEHAANLPASCLIPTVTDAQEIISLAGQPLVDARSLRRVVDLPADLDLLSPRERAAVDKFLAWAEREGVRESYVVRHRKPWWRVNLKAPPPIIMTYMGRRPPAFARNLAGARLLNIAHGLYPLAPVAEPVLNALVAWLNQNVALADGRTYAGGLTKFEPGEAMRIPIPPLSYFRDVA